MCRSLARSTDEVRIHPTAAAELTAIHLVAGAAGSWRWALTSWFLCITHLGLLGDSPSLGWPNRLTLLRALLPSLAPDSPQASVIALATDFADGRLARAGGESAFGGFADPIADGVFWSWYALRWEHNPWLRWVPITLFGGSAAVIAVTYFGRGRTIDYPRLLAVRYLSAVMQITLAVRTLCGVSLTKTGSAVGRSRLEKEGATRAGAAQFDRKGSAGGRMRPARRARLRTSDERQSTTTPDWPRGTTRWLS